MSQSESFARYVEESYEHLYDLPYLGEHPIAPLLLPDFVSHRKENGWKVHQILLAAIEQLAPLQKAPVFSREWRRQRLMMLRYVDGLPIDNVALQIAVSRRQYYRVLADAFAALTAVLMAQAADRLAAILPPSTSTDSGGDQSIDTSPADVTDRIALLRLEAARVNQSQQYADIQSVLDGVLDIMAAQLSHNQITVITELDPALPQVMIGQNLLRQLLLSILDYYNQIASRSAVTFTAATDQGTVALMVQASIPASDRQIDAAESLGALLEMARLDAQDVTPQYENDILTGLTLRLAAQSVRNVLIVDDNQDVLMLFQHYLNMHHYQPFPVQTAQEAKHIAEETPLYAILLDLMMPGQDGWDLLRALLANPVTQRIPVIVCSVLRQRHLALSLGATLFLEKPVGEETLADALDSLTHADRLVGSLAG